MTVYIQVKKDGGCNVVKGKTAPEIKGTDVVKQLELEEAPTRPFRYDLKAKKIILQEYIEIDDPNKELDDEGNIMKVNKLIDK